jgi:hypothetical protein
LIAAFLYFYQIYTNRYFIPGSAFEDSTCPLLLYATPLLEEKRDIRSQALIPNSGDIVHVVYPAHVASRHRRDFCKHASVACGVYKKFLLSDVV